MLLKFPADLTNSEDEDYSLSVSAVMQRRASTKGHHNHKKSSIVVGSAAAAGITGYISPRRASSPMGHVIALGGSIGGVGGSGGTAASSFDRRRSSVYTTSSGE